MKKIIIICSLLIFFPTFIHAESLSESSIELSEKISIKDTVNLQSNSNFFLSTLISSIGGGILLPIFIISSAIIETTFGKWFNLPENIPIGTGIVIPLFFVIYIVNSDSVLVFLNLILHNMSMSTQIANFLPVSAGGFLMLTYYNKYAPSSLKDYSEKVGYENVVREYSFITKSMIIAFSIVGIIISLLILPLGIKITEDVTQQFWFKFASGVLFSADLVGAMFLLRIMLFLTNEKFRYYLAKGNFVLALNKTDEVKKIHYLIDGITSYNKFLKRHAKMKIRDLSSIISSFTMSFSNESDDSLSNLMNSFDNKHFFKPLHYLSKFYKDYELNPYTVEVSSKDMLKDWGPQIIGIFASIVSIVSTFLVQHPSVSH